MLNGALRRRLTRKKFSKVENGDEITEAGMESTVASNGDATGVRYDSKTLWRFAIGKSVNNNEQARSKPKLSAKPSGGRGCWGCLARRRFRGLKKRKGGEDIIAAINSLNKDGQILQNGHSSRVVQDNVAFDGMGEVESPTLTREGESDGNADRIVIDSVQPGTSKQGSQINNNIEGESDGDAERIDSVQPGTSKVGSQINNNNGNGHLKSSFVLPNAIVSDGSVDQEEIYHTGVHYV